MLFQCLQKSKGKWQDSCNMSLSLYEHMKVSTKFMWYRNVEISAVKKITWGCVIFYTFEICKFHDNKLHDKNYSVISDWFLDRGAHRGKPKKSRWWLWPCNQIPALLHVIHEYCLLERSGALTVWLQLPYRLFWPLLLTLLKAVM